MIEDDMIEIQEQLKDKLTKNIANNTWDNIDDFMRVLDMAREGKWHWFRDFNCKYVDIRVDMRDGGCIIRDRNGDRILPEQLMRKGT